MDYFKIHKQGLCLQPLLLKHNACILEALRPLHTWGRRIKDKRKMLNSRVCMVCLGTLHTSSDASWLFHPVISSPVVWQKTTIQSNILKCKIQYVKTLANSSCIFLHNKIFANLIIKPYIFVLFNLASMFAICLFFFAAYVVPLLCCLVH